MSAPNPTPQHKGKYVDVARYQADTGPGFGGMPLGQQTDYVDVYTPSLLCPLMRSVSRAGLDGYVAGEDESVPSLPFLGEDIWTAFELSWLDERGRPRAAVLRLRVSCDSPCMVESKSLKLYLNSLAQTRFGSLGELQRTIDADLSLAFRAPVGVEVLEPHQLGPVRHALAGQCIDNENVDLNCYERAPELLSFCRSGKDRHETLHTNVFRSLCPVTGQPDFAHVSVEYSGRAIDPGSLLAYLVSYRRHSGFHETTIEQIFLDLLHFGEFTQLNVYARFLRRGGIDINPFRSLQDSQAPQLRLSRQ